MTLLSDFLSQHASKNKSVITHTRIPDKDRNIYGGSYHIPSEELATFYDLYYAHVFERHHEEYLTELQPELGTLAIDIDFRYKTAERKYDNTHIVSFIELIGELLETLVAPKVPIPVYVFEKPTINIQPKEIKDGIHFIFGIRLDRTVREMLYRRLLRKMSIWGELEEHLTNSWESVLDHGVFVGTTGWQLYGSRKPGYMAYKLTGVYVCKDDGSGMETFSHKLNHFDVSERISELSVQYGYPVGELKPQFIDEYERLRNPQKVAPVVTGALTQVSEIDRKLEEIFTDPELVRLRETHEYAMCLPPPYFDEYEKWIRVGWALKNTSPLMFPSWIKFSSQSSKFDYGQVLDMQEKWDSWMKKENKLTEKSIAYWARNENEEAYNAIRTKTLDFLVSEVILQKNATEFDYATILHFMYKDSFACTSIRNKTWYEYSGQRWTETDSGTNLRRKISAADGVLKLFQKKMVESQGECQKYDSVTQPEKFEAARKRPFHIASLMTDLKRTDKKQNIMREACDLFFIPKFISLLDSKNHILCFQWMK